MSQYSDFVSYGYCPRGAGDLEAHRRKFLVHRSVSAGRDDDGQPITQMCCMDDQLAAALDRDRVRL